MKTRMKFRLLHKEVEWNNHRNPELMVIGLGLGILWLAVFQKFDHSPTGDALLGFHIVVRAIVGLVALWSMVSLVRGGQLTLPAGLLLSLWGWLFLRDFLNGDLLLHIVIGGAIVVIALHAHSLTSRDLSNFYLVVPVGFALASVLFVLFDGESSFRPDGYSDFFGELALGQFMGVATHPNQFAPVMALGILIVFTRSRPSGLWLAMAGFFAVGLILSGSDGTIAALSVALVVAGLLHDWLNRSSKKPPWRSLIAISAALAIAIGSFVLIATRGIANFSTGRTRIWSSYVEPARDAGLFGFGHFPEIVDNPVFNEIAVQFRDPHNAFLATQVTGGYLGSILQLAFWVSVLIAVWRMSPSPQKNLAGGIIAFLLVAGIVESHLYLGLRMFIPFFVLLVALAGQDRRETRLSRSRQ